MTKPGDPVYDPEDLLWLARDVPLMKLATEGLGGSVLDQTVATLEAGQTDPDGSDFDPVAGGLARCLAVYGPDVRDDLLLRNAHRSLQTLGGLLVMLAPLPGDEQTLSTCVARPGPRPWLLTLVDRVHREEAEGHPSVETIDRLRGLMDQVPRPKTQLWRIDQTPVDQIKALQKRMADVYAAEGADAAHAVYRDAMAPDRQDVLARYLRYKRRR